MAFIDDQNGRPTLQKFLDLLPTKPQTEEEVQNLLYKLPELKLRPEKVPDDVVFMQSSRDFPYLNPIPASMAHVKIHHLSKVDIDWKMLTLERPETALEIQIFSRIVFLSKITLKCMEREKMRRERAQSLRLLMKGRVPTVTEGDVDRSDEFTYEYFSRFYGAAQDRAQAIEEAPKDAPKVPPPEETKPVQMEEVLPLFEPKKRKKIVRKKKRKKSKLRKRRTTNKTILSKVTKKKSRKKGQKLKFKRKRIVVGKTLVKKYQNKPKKKEG